MKLTVRVQDCYRDHPTDPVTYVATVSNGALWRQGWGDTEVQAASAAVARYRAARAVRREQARRLTK